MILTMYDMLGLRGVAFSVGEEADEWLDEVVAGRYTGELPELALLDIRLPDNISGTDIAARIRRIPALKDMVICLMTAYRLSAKEEDAVMRQARADLLIYKPFPHFHELHYRLHTLLVERYGGAGAGAGQG